MASKQIVFLIILLFTFGFFLFTINRLRLYFTFTKPFHIKQPWKKIYTTLKVAIAQCKIFRWPFTGFLHALVFWGFIVITVGSVEMVVDGLTGTERSLAFLGVFYNIIIGSGDVFALVVLLAILVFLSRRLLTKVNRFTGIELKQKSKLDALVALSIILLLMVSLLGMNIGYIALHAVNYKGIYPVSGFLQPYIVDVSNQQMAYIFHEVNWWAHILLIFIFANILPYSKHFHVFTSVPNVFLSRLEPLSHLPNMPEIERKVKAMLTGQVPESTTAPSRFGVKDVEDVTWKNIFDSLACS